MSVSSEVRRTLVKSPPELWAELSDPAALGRHLGELGEIRIVRTEPERTVDWEAAAVDGAEVSGRVEITPSGWGTKVTLSATRSVTVPEPEPETAEVTAEPETTDVTAEADPEPELPIMDEPEPRRGFFARIFRRRRTDRMSVEPQIEPETAVEPAAAQALPEDETVPEADIAAELTELEEQTTAVLTGVLDRLGAAHHRPFSRA